MLIDRTASPLGEIILCAHEGALRGLWFAGQKYACRGAEEALPPSAGDRACLERARLWTAAYFAWERPEADFPLEPPGTPFQQRVWRALLEIPYGECLSYGELARRTDCKSPRAVGAAVGKNPISLIIPCHRVCGRDGSLTGYAGGLWRKEYLLALERE